MIADYAIDREIAALLNNLEAPELSADFVERTLAAAATPALPSLQSWQRRIRRRRWVAGAVVTVMIGAAAAAAVAPPGLIRSLPIIGALVEMVSPSPAEPPSGEPTAETSSMLPNKTHRVESGLADAPPPRTEILSPQSGDQPRHQVVRVPIDDSGPAAAPLVPLATDRLNPARREPGLLRGTISSSAREPVRDAAPAATSRAVEPVAADAVPPDTIGTVTEVRAADAIAPMRDSDSAAVRTAPSTETRRETRSASPRTPSPRREPSAPRQPRQPRQPRS